MDLTAIYLIALPAGLYARAVRILARRGYRVPRWQQASWYAGLLLMAIALLSPLDSLGETDLLSAHMAQHLLIADLSAHVTVPADSDCHARRAELERLLEERFDIEHTTLQVDHAPRPGPLQVEDLRGPPRPG